MDYNPINLLQQPQTTCERPVVVAVRDMFFVVWTRRYDHTNVALFPGQEDGPAILECAWVEKSTNPLQPIQTYPDYQDPLNTTKGLGFELDAHVVGIGTPKFLARECLGVADAVMLSDANLTADEYKVGIVYPHQTQFSSAGSLNRQFTNRLITCKFDRSSSVISPGPITELQTQVAFNGPTSPTGAPSAGLILPDLAPSSLDNSFWMVAESQTINSGLPDGRIRLEYWELDSGGNTWTSTFGTTFKSPSGGTPYVRRRPNISSYPPTSTSAGEQMVSVAFNKRNPDPVAADQSSQVIYKEVAWQNGSTNVHLVVNVPWDNDAAFNDGKTVPLRGRDYPFIRRCFADRAPIAGGPPDDLLSWNDITEAFTSIDDVQLPDDGGVARPAATYHYHSGAASPDYIAVSWERRTLASDVLRVWLGVE